MIDYKKLGNILMDWSIRNKEYDISYLLFTQFKVSIPVKLLYVLPSRRVLTLDTFRDKSKILTPDLLAVIKGSKYGLLEEGEYGYICNGV